MKRLTPSKIAQLHHALHYVLDSNDIPADERAALEAQMTLLHNIYRRLSGEELV